MDNDKDRDDDKDQDEDLNVKEQRTKELIRQILSALSYMHGKDFVHKGIAPENIYLKNNGEVIIFDQMLFRKTKKKVEQNEEEEDHPYYSAPEVIKSKYQTYEKSTDVWSAGIIMYNLLSGSQPFDGEDRREVEKSILECNLEFPKTEFDNVS